jgi:hypothetical protein
MDKAMNAIETWYKDMTKFQKIFVYAISIALSVMLIGLIPLAFLIYLELGAKGRGA